MVKTHKAEDALFGEDDDVEDGSISLDQIKQSYISQIERGFDAAEENQSSDGITNQVVLFKAFFRTRIFVATLCFQFSLFWMILYL